MTQLTLEEATGSRPIRNDLEEAYRVWLAKNPKVFGLFERFALQMLEKHRRFGIGMVAERVRWEVRMVWEVDADGFKINDHHTAYIARDLIAKYPGLADLIETRKIRGEEPEAA